ncbi:MAG TPA: hypothetical protein VH988_26810 [Thermoanaerobaculia bacterium]|nr:hypothetical protein [Thermoanaerobaculia bacterium]
MSGAGIRFTLLTGANTPVPAPPSLIDALESVEVSHSDADRSGFQIQFRVGRVGQGGIGNQNDYALLASPSLATNNRVILVVHFGAFPKVLMDGVITHQQLAPGMEPGTSTLTVTGEDLTLVMDQENKQAEHPAQGEMVIVFKILGRYSRFGLIPAVIPPKVFDVPVPTDRIPVQSGTDLAYLREMAGRYGYVFYVKPGPAPFTNTAYWGPPIRFGTPQHALTVGMGHFTNVDSIHFENDSLQPTLVTGKVQDRKTNKVSPVKIFSTLRLPLAQKSVLTTQRKNARKVPFRDSGLTTSQARARAQAMTDESMDRVVTATGELDTIRYGHVLEARKLVGLRGVGKSYDGLYYVKSVTHRLRPGAYTQSFVLTREGTGTTVPGVFV